MALGLLGRAEVGRAVGGGGGAEALGLLLGGGDPRGVPGLPGRVDDIASPISWATRQARTRHYYTKPSLCQ